MATAISDPHELQELIGLLEQEGLHVPDDVQTVEELVRYLLISCKTKAATEALQDAKLARQRSDRDDDSDDNPDAPTPVDQLDDKDARQALYAGQFSTAGDGRRVRRIDAAARAKAAVDAQERFHKNPNFARPAY